MTIVIADIYAIVRIVQSPVAVEVKVLWMLIVLILPLLGLIAWPLAGPGGRRF